MPSIAQRNEVLYKTGGYCWYCGEMLGFENRHADNFFEVDHMVSRTYGGTDDFSNLVPACRQCNRRKNVYSLDQFRLILTGSAYELFYGERLMLNSQQRSVSPERWTELVCERVGIAPFTGPQISWLMCHGFDVLAELNSDVAGLEIVDMQALKAEVYHA